MSEAAEAETIERPAGEGSEAQAGAESSEDKARRMGWRPQAELEAEGKKLPKYKTADEFLEDGKKYEPFIKANNEALEKALTKTKEELAKVQADLKQFGEFHTKAVAREYERALADLEAQQEAAAAAGDVEGVKKATKGIVALGKEAEADQKGAPDAEWQSAEQKWKAENKWFDGEEPGNRAMTVYALAQDRELASEKPNFTPAQRLAEVTKRVKAEFPDKFVNPNRERPGAVEGVGNAKLSTGKTFSDLPKEAQAFCDRMVKSGTITRDAYVKGYQWDTK